MAGTVRQVTAGGRGAPTTKRHGIGYAIGHTYGMFVPRGATATGPHGVHPGTGHISHVNGGRSVHPAVNLPYRVERGPTIPTPQHPVRRGPVSPIRGVPVRRGPVFGTQPGLPPPVTPPTIPPSVVVNPPGPSSGAITQVGGLVQQTNAGGTTSGVGGGAFGPRAATGGYFADLGSPADFLANLSWVHAAEIAAVVVAGLYAYRHLGRKGRR